MPQAPLLVPASGFKAGFSPAGLTGTDLQTLSYISMTYRCTCVQQYHGKILCFLWDILLNAVITVVKQAQHAYSSSYSP